jgi:hypothetical protein
VHGKAVEHAQACGEAPARVKESPARGVSVDPSGTRV